MLRTDGTPFRILTLSCVYPNSRETTYGIFVHHRLSSVAAGADVKVIAPVPVLDYANPGKSLLGNRYITRIRQSGNIEVLHPRWLYPPSGGALTAGCLGARLIPFIQQLRRSYPFDVIDAHFGYPDGIAASLIAACTGHPFTITLRGSETMHARYSTRKRAMAWALRRAARVITVSESLRRFAISLGASPDRVTTIPNGIDATVFKPGDRSAVRQKLGIAPGVPLILSAGYLIERKGHHHALQALHQLHKNGSSARLVIAGGPGREGRFEGHIQELTDRLGLRNSVIFTGSLSSGALAEWMLAADVFCLASSREGWPNVVHEAMGCGTPVVAFDVGGVSEMLAVPGHGIVVPAGNQPALQEALSSALTRQWDRDCISAWAQARSWQQVGRETLAELISAAGA